MEVTPGRPEDRPWLEAFLHDQNALRVARRGELVESLDHPALLVQSSDGFVGAATYIISDGECELLTLHVSPRFAGAGTALLSGVQAVARRAGCGRLWVVTTNDNVDALRFYQRRGFRLAHLRPGAVDESRKALKPEIPPTGSHHIPLRDELELELLIADR